MVAISIKKFSSNICPCKIFTKAFFITSYPIIIYTIKYKPKGISHPKLFSRLSKWTILSIINIIKNNTSEKIPLDGIVIKGRTSLDTKALTGESIPRDVKENENVLSGCVNLTSQIEIIVTKEFYDSTVSKILDLVENASSQKSKTENFIMQKMVIEANDQEFDSILKKAIKVAKKIEPDFEIEM